MLFSVIQKLINYPFHLTYQFHPTWPYSMTFLLLRFIRKFTDIFLQRILIMLESVPSSERITRFTFLTKNSNVILHHFCLLMQCLHFQNSCIVGGKFLSCRILMPALINPSNAQSCPGLLHMSPGFLQMQKKSLNDRRWKFNWKINDLNNHWIFVMVICQDIKIYLEGK